MSVVDIITFKAIILENSQFLSNGNGTLESRPKKY